MTTATKIKKPRPFELDGCHLVQTEGSILVPAARAVVITIGLELKSQHVGRSNNWRATAGRNKQLRKRTMHALNLVWLQHVERHLGGHPRVIRFTRLAPRTLDSDNNLAAFKPIRDQLCAWLSGSNTLETRANDGLRSGYVFDYAQQQQRAYGVRLELGR